MDGQVPGPSPSHFDVALTQVDSGDIHLPLLPKANSRTTAAAPDVEQHRIELRILAESFCQPVNESELRFPTPMTLPASRIANIQKKVAPIVVLEKLEDLGMWTVAVERCHDSFG